MESSAQHATDPIISTSYTYYGTGTYLAVFDFLCLVLGSRAVDRHEILRRSTSMFQMCLLP